MRKLYAVYHRGMNRTLGIALLAPVSLLALPAAADSAFTVKCSTKTSVAVPKGSNSAARYDYTLTVNPNAQVVTLSGQSYPATVNEHDVYFATPDGKLKVYLSRKHNTFGQLVDLGQADPASTLIYSTGTCSKG